MDDGIPIPQEENSKESESGEGSYQTPGILFESLKDIESGKPSYDS